MGQSATPLVHRLLHLCGTISAVFVCEHKLKPPLLNRQRQGSVMVAYRVEKVGVENGVLRQRQHGRLYHNAVREHARIPVVVVVVTW